MYGLTAVRFAGEGYVLTLTYSKGYLAVSWELVLLLKKPHLPVTKSLLGRLALLVLGSG